MAKPFSGKIEFVLLLFLLLLSICPQLNAQTVQFSGKVTDSVGNPLVYANVIANPQLPNNPSDFSITDKNGDYKIKLKTNAVYRLKITHLGFGKLTDSVQISENTKKDYTLLKSTEQLEEVVIKQQMAVVVKGDTITYNVEHFENGSERKLRDILQKLPGVEVDNEGNVTVQGKKVNKLMIEGQEFFTGDPKLGVNNIPADAVDQVTALKNYSEVGMLKNLESSDRLALNIKLKKDKKNFVFGQSEAGGGFTDRYYVNPNLFYYSRNTSINILGDFNNTGKNSFDSSIYDLSGGFSMMTTGRNRFGRQLGGALTGFLPTSGFTFKKTDFGAGSIDQKVGKNARLHAYTIFGDGKTQTRSTHENNYFSQENTNEFRENTSKKHAFYTLNKVKYRYDNNDDTDMIINLLFKSSNAAGNAQTTSKTADETNFFNTKTKPDNLQFIQTLSYNKKYSYKNTLSINTNLEYNEDSNSNDWLFDQPVFSDLIPFENNGDSYNVFQNTSTVSRLAQIDVKYYHILNRTNHIYPNVGLNYISKDFSTKDAQILQNGDHNSFRDAGFNNNLHFQLFDAFAGFEYKVMFGKLLMRAAIFAHTYFWNAVQFEHETVNNNKTVFLPQFKATYKFNNEKKIVFRYDLVSNFAQGEQFANRLQLRNFNSIYRGNEDLENELYHSMDLTYDTYAFKTINVRSSLGYNHRLESIRSRTKLKGIDFISTDILTSLPDNNYNASLYLSKYNDHVTYNLNGNVGFRNYKRIVNNEILGYNSNSFSYGAGIDFHQKNWPNVELNFDQSFSFFSSENGSETKFMRVSPSLDIDYNFWKDFIFKVDYQFNYYENKATGQNNTFGIGNASIFYEPKDNPWGFGIDAKNIFDVDYENNNYTTNFLVSDSRTYLQPRIILFKISYRL